jgi:hypothetical protein
MNQYQSSSSPAAATTVTLSSAVIASAYQNDGLLFCSQWYLKREYFEISCRAHAQFRINLKSAGALAVLGRIGVEYI